MGCLTVSVFNPIYLEPEDDGPDEPQGEAMVAIHNVVGAHVLQVDSLLLEELQGLVHVLQAVDAHAPLGGLGLEREERHLLLKIYTNAYYSLLTLHLHYIYSFSRCFYPKRLPRESFTKVHRSMIITMRYPQHCR